MYIFVLDEVKIYTMPKNKKIKAEENSLIASEPMASYAMDTDRGILSVVSRQSETHLSTFEKMKVVKEGISKKDLEFLKAKTEMDYSSLARILSVTRATLINKKKNDKFGSSISEKILDIADLYSYGFEVFEDESVFRRWMDTPNRALNSLKPFDLLDNQFGREEVKNLIGRIAYGVYS